MDPYLADLLAPRHARSPTAGVGYMSAPSNSRWKTHNRGGARSTARARDPDGPNAKRPLRSDGVTFRSP